jgi:hypothetical protein
VKRRVLVLGGTGEFGRRLVRGLIETTDIDVVIAARGLARVQAFMAELATDRATAAVLDTRTVAPEELRGARAVAVVDAAGPFQGADYRLARAEIAAGMHYVDLADARDFVAGFGALDEEARAEGVVALTGASSTPALSHAVLDRLTAGWQRVDRVEIAILPGNRAAPRGVAVIRSILSYAGKPVRVFRDGRWKTCVGWGMTTRRDMPGLGARWLSLCETPDLDLVPSRFTPRQAALFRAGLELSVVHLGLLAASFAVRLGLLESLLPFTGPFRWIAERLRRFGSAHGGMVVEAVGIDAAEARARATWSLLAEGGDGPVVPRLPALALLRSLCEGTVPPAGARACVGILGLDAIEREFQPYRIKTAIVREPLHSPLQAVLGSDFSRLPEPVRRLHGLAEDVVTTGLAEIVRSRNPLARLLCSLAGLPSPGTDVPVTVAFGVHERSEYWRRRFGGRGYASRFTAADGAQRGLLVERFFPFRLYFRLTASAHGLAWRLVEWRLFGFPLPRRTLPEVNCFESADGARFVFDINVRFPMIGPVIHYRGWLLPAKPLGEG